MRFDLNFLNSLPRTDDFTRAQLSRNQVRQQNDEHQRALEFLQAQRLNNQYLPDRLR